MKNQIASSLSLGLLLILLGIQPIKAATYYSNGNNAPNLTSSWKTNTNGTGTSPSNFTTAGDIFTVQNGHTMTSSGTWTVTGTVQINSGGTIALGANNITISGGTTVNGTLNITSTTGTKTFANEVTINSGGTWNNTANEAVTFSGNLANNGTFNAGTAVQTFSGANKTINGNIFFTRLTVSGTCANNGTINVSTALAGTGALTQGENAILYIGGSSAITTLNATNTGNSVIYNSTGNQTAHVNSYYNLTLSTGGTKTITGISTINGTLTIDNATVIPSTGLTIGGDIVLNNNFNFTTGAYTHNIAGNWTQNGWGTVTATSGSTINFTGNNSAINGTNTNSNTVNFYNLTVAKNTDATLSLAGSFSSINVANDLTLNTGTFANGSTQVKITGNWTNNNGFFTAGDGYVSMIGTGKTIGGNTPTTFNNLEIGNSSSGYTTYLGNSQNVLGTLKMSNGLLRLGANNITLGANTTISGSLFNGNMIITDGVGEVRKIFSDNGSFTFPIGDTGPYYTPATINFTSGSYEANAYVGVRVTNAIEPSNTSTTNHITRYWSVSQNGISQSKYDFTGSSIFSDDNVGSRTNSLTAISNNNIWTTYATPAGDTFSITNLSTFGNITTVNNLPVINTSATSLSDFRYTLGAGPSPQQAVSVSGYAMSGSTVITAPTNYEISTTSGSGFTNSITLNSVATNLPETTLYIRLKSGLSTGTYNQNITLVSGSTTKTLSVAGMVYPAACPYAGNTNSTIVHTPTINMTSYVNTVSSSFSTNTYFILNVVKGLTYQIYTCNTPSSPLKISVYEEGNASNFITSSISNTGNTCNTNANNVYVSFTSPISGQVRVLLNAQSSCTATAITGLTVNVNVPSGSNTGDDANAAGNNTWIGHMYDGTALFNNYIGYYNTTAYGGKTDEFQEQFGTGGTFPNADNNDVATFNIYASGSVRAKILDVTFTTRYRMTSTKRGFWTFSTASDDGARLYVDGVLTYNYWNDHSPVTNTNMLMSLTGNSSLILDFYENGGQNIIGFYGLTKVMDNLLTTNATQTICLGNALAGLPISGDVIPGTLPAGLTAGGYTWSYSTTPNGPRTIISGATSATFTPDASAPFNIPGTYYIYRNATINSSNSVSVTTYPYNANQTNESNAAVIVIKACNNYWVGTVSTNWGTNTNWKTGYIPAFGDDVVFATAANNNGTAALNDLQLDADRTIGNLINETDKKLIIPTYKALTIAGAVTTPTNDPNLIQIKASSTAPNGSLIFKQPSLNTNIGATVEMYAKGYYGTAVQWTDDFDPNQIGSVHTNYYRWQYFGIPVQSIQAQPTFEGSWLREYSESNNGTGFYQKWKDLVNESILSPFKGYEITQNTQKIIAYQGNLVVGDKTLTLTVSSGYGSGYNIFSNSYTAAIDISKMQFPVSGVEKTVYLYNTGTFSDWGKGNLAGSYTAIPYNTSSIIGNEIPSMQGFMLKASTNNSTVTIPYNSTTSSATKNMTQQRVKREIASADQSDDSTLSTANSENLSFLKIEVSSDSTYDCTWVFDAENTSHDFDNGWDGSKLMGTTGMCIYSDEVAGSLQVNTLDNINDVYLGFRPGNDTQYTMQIQSENILDKYDNLYIKDLKNGVTTKLDKNSVTYHFIADKPQELSKRFLISGTKKEIEKVNPLKIVQQQNKIKILNNGTESGTLYLYDVLGKTLISANCQSQSTVEITNNLSKGVYLINFKTDKRNNYTKKLIIE